MLHVENWQKYAENGTAMGPNTASVTLVVFSDFQCPFCRRFAADLREVRQRYPSDVRVIFHHFPLPSHQFARPAAIAAECTARAHHFEQMHDLLFELQDSLGIASWTHFAQRAGVQDSVAFLACLRDPTVTARIEHDLALGRDLGVMGTPTILVNATEVVGSPPATLLDSLIRSAREQNASKPKGPTADVESRPKASLCKDGTLDPGSDPASCAAHGGVAEVLIPTKKTDVVNGGTGLARCRDGTTEPDIGAKACASHQGVKFRIRPPE